MNQQPSRLIQSISTALTDHTIVLKSFIDLFRRFFFSWTITRLRILALWLPLIIVFSWIPTFAIIAFTISGGGSTSGFINFIASHPIIASVSAIILLLILILALYMFVWSNLFLIRACLSYAQKQNHVFACRKYLSDWNLHKALLRFIIVWSLGILAYTVIVTFSTSLVLLGVSGDALDIFSTFIALVGVLILAGLWYSFAANMMRYSRRQIWMIYTGYITLVLISFFISALGFSEKALISMSVNGQSFILRIGEIPSMIVITWCLFMLLSLFLSYVWSMVLFARQMEKPSSTWFDIFHKSYDFSFGQRKKVLWLILPFWLALVWLTWVIDSSFEKIISHRSYQVLSQELQNSNQKNTPSSDSQKEWTDQDVIWSYLIPAAFSGDLADRQINPNILAIFDQYEPSNDSINKELYEQMSLIINHEIVGTHSAKTLWGQFPFVYYSISYFFMFLDWIFLSGLLYYTIVNGYLYLKKNHTTPYIHE